MINIMLYQAFAALLTSVALGNARDTGKLMKTVPTISNSLVNLGKMEISFYFNGKHPEIEPKSDHSSRTGFFPPPQMVEQSCPCSSFKGSGSSFLTDPTEVINKILKSNDLFKDPTSSFCCDSHEQTQESTVFFDVSPIRSPIFNAAQKSNKFASKTPIPRPYFSIFDTTSNKGTVKPKAVEILLFPKRKDLATLEFSNLFNFNKRQTPKPDIQVVGDKELNFKLPSVKKDLTLLEKKNKPEVTTIQEQMNTDAPPITNVNNTL